MCAFLHYYSLKSITDYGRHTGAYNAMVKAVEKDANPKKLITLEEAKKAGK